MFFRALQACAGLMEEIADGVVIAQSRHNDWGGRIGNLPVAVGKGDNPAGAVRGIGTMPAERGQLEGSPAGQKARHE